MFKNEDAARTENPAGYLPPRLPIPLTWGEVSARIWFVLHTHPVVPIPTARVPLLRTPGYHIPRQEDDTPTPFSLSHLPGFSITNNEGPGRRWRRVANIRVS
jgi:hypothetical protein